MAGVAEIYPRFSFRRVCKSFIFHGIDGLISPGTAIAVTLAESVFDEGVLPMPVPYAGMSVNAVLRQAMEVASLNHRLIANNIANADTPNFTPTKLEFHDALKTALAGRDRVDLRTTRSRHIELSRQPLQFNSIAHLSKNDYNKVDLEQELADLAQNTSRFNSYTDFLGQRFRSLRSTLQSVNR
jgi:flagellar basal-body rod protein FlgB